VVVKQEPPSQVVGLHQVIRGDGVVMIDWPHRLLECRLNFGDLQYMSTYACSNSFILILLISIHVDVCLT
jgi:hypothetical protein